MLDIAFLAMLLWIVNFYLEPTARFELLPAWAADNGSPMLIWLFLCLFTIKNIAAWLVTRSQFRFIGDVAVRISSENLLSFQQSGMESFTKTDSSFHIRKICFQPFEFAQYMLAGWQQVIAQSFLVMIALAAIIIFNPQVFLLLLLILLPPVAIVFHFIRKKLGKAKTDIQDSNERSFRYLLDALNGFVEGNILNKNRFFHNRFTRHRREFSTHLFNSHSLQALPSRMMEIFAILGLFLLMTIATWNGSADQSSLITIAAFVAAAYKIIPGIVKIVNVSGQIKAYDFQPAELTSGNNIESQNEVAEARDAVREILIDGMGFNFGSSALLRDFSLSLKKGDLAGITGASGKGKTTLLNILLGFHHHHKGELRINNTQVTNGEAKRFWPSFTYVRQQTFLIHDTLLRNITLEESGHDRERLEWVMRLSGLDNLVNTWPDGIQTEIMENGRNISGGQQQRISIARALYKNADVILLDEPFNELDRESSVNLMKNLKEIANGGKIIVLITHEKELLNHCNKIVSLDE